MTSTGPASNHMTAADLPGPTTTPAAVRLVERFYECYATGDLQTMKDEILAEDVVWHIPGRHPLSGPKRGTEEITIFFGQLAKANMKAEVVYLSGNDTQVVDVHRGWGATDRARIDMLWVLYYRIEDGRIKEVVNFAADQAQSDNFFWASYKLVLSPRGSQPRDGLLGRGHHGAPARAGS